MQSSRVKTPAEWHGLPISSNDSPNAITAAGFALIVAQIALLFYYSADLLASPPKWFYLLAAATLWIYASFDAIDGKQARRTMQSGPLGELFDHCFWFFFFSQPFPLSKRKQAAMQ